MQQMRKFQTSRESQELFYNHVRAIVGRTNSLTGKPYSEDPARYERLSLKNYVRKNNPQTFFIEAGLEHLFPSEYTRKIAEEHRAMGIESHWKVYPRVEHGFFYELKRQAQLEAFEDLCRFLDGKLETF